MPTENQPILFRSLRADELECRVYKIENKGCYLHLYKNARSDMTLLDETVGAENWQRKHYTLNGNTYCSVGVNVSFKDKKLPPVWVWKDDCGEKVSKDSPKADSSDSFKRACVNWGIGRELYTAPAIYIHSEKVNVSNNGTQDLFKVEKILVENGRIIGLSIFNTTKNVRAFAVRVADDGSD